MECRANLQIGFNFFLMESITLGTSYYTGAFCKRPTLPTLVFELWEGSCTGSLNNIPVDLADMFEDEVRTPLPLPLDKPLEK